MIEITEGHWFENKLHGFCFLQKEDGTTFEGLFVHGKREGFGKETYSHDPTHDWKEGVWVSNIL